VRCYAIAVSAALTSLPGLPPLPSEAADQLHLVWEWDLPAPPEALWPLVSNSDRFNYDARLPREVITAVDRSLGLPRQRVGVAALGLTIEIVQRPVQWVEPRWFSIYRTLDKGPCASFRLVCQLLPSGDGTRLRYETWSGTRGGALGRALWLFHMRRNIYPPIDRTFRRYAELAVTAGGSVADRPGAGAAAQRGVRFTPSPTPVEFAPGGAERLACGLAELLRQPVGPALVPKLGEVLQAGDALLVSRLQPYVLADEWDAPRRAVLELCLRATRLGLLDLRWDLLCPLCRGAKHTATSLSGVRREEHCEACNVDYEVNFERQVELSFRVNSAIRPAPDLLYCAGAPGLTPHIAVQLELQPGEERTVDPALTAGRYRLRCDNERGGRYLRVEEAAVAAEAAQQFSCAIDPATWPEDEPALASRPQLTLANASARPQLVLLERLAWADDAVTAAEVTSLQLFRDLFSAEALRPDEQISVGRVVVLFTDLVGSTRLYRDIGDAPAFGRVMSHFDVLRDRIAAHGGAIVKTMGDAVLGVFTAPLPALEAMLEAQAELAAANPPLLLKAGLHLGPCIAVTLNDRLDYFGTTVNFAARLAHVAQGLEIVLSDAAHRDPQVTAWLHHPPPGVRLEEHQAELKGFEEDMARLWRVNRR
jgi:class 3 adenylate cyclase